MFPSVSWMIGDVAQEQDWERLGKLVVAARVAHGMHTRDHLAKVGGFSTRFLGDIEKARRANYDPSYLARLERALGWATGSIDDILDGGEPTIQQPVAPKPAPAEREPAAMSPRNKAIIRVMESKRVPEAEKRRIVDILLADQAAAQVAEEQRRMTLAEELMRPWEETG